MGLHTVLNEANPKLFNTFGNCPNDQNNHVKCQNIVKIHVKDIHDFCIPDPRTGLESLVVFKRFTRQSDMTIQ